MPPKLDVGSHVGPFVLGKWLGGGGNGTVWHTKSARGEACAIKVLRPDIRHDDGLARFKREIAALKQLGALPGILPLLDSDTSGTCGYIWYTMPVAERLRVRLGADPSLAAVCGAIANIAQTLHTLHAKGVVHRDIKPDNLFWHNNKWCLGDFGLVDLPGAENLTEDGQKLGPAYYIAPEMLNSAASADGKKCDVYSLGKTLWVLATGQRYPLPGECDSALKGAGVSAYVSHERVKSLDNLLLRMTRHDPLIRPDAQSVSKELMAWVSHPPAPVGEGPPEDILHRLKELLAPQARRNTEAAERATLATHYLSQFRGFIRKTALGLDQAVGTKSEPGVELPVSGEHHEYLGAAGIEWSSRITYGCDAGSPGGRRDRMTIYANAVLTTDGLFHVYAGYAFDTFVRQHNITELGVPPGWQATTCEPLGGPMCESAVQRLLGEMTTALPGVLQEFGRRIERA